MPKLVATFRAGLVVEEVVVESEMRLETFAQIAAERSARKTIKLLGTRHASRRDLRVVPHLLDS